MSAEQKQEAVARAPEQIIGKDALLQLVFEGYAVVAASSQERIAQLEALAQRYYELLRECQSEFRARGADGLVETIATTLGMPLPAALVEAAPEGRWRYSINFGPEGEEDWANLTTPKGEHVANIRTRHAVAIVHAIHGVSATLEAPGAAK